MMVTNIIAEIANSYYELMALDNLLAIIQQNIELQSSALQVVKWQKDAAKATQLAVNRFEAQLLNTKNLQYEIQQKIVETDKQAQFALSPRLQEAATIVIRPGNYGSCLRGSPGKLYLLLLANFFRPGR